MTAMGIIGGTAFKELDDLRLKEKIKSHTPWGSPSSHIYKGELAGKDVILIFRHGDKHDIPPHMVNTRANIYALQREVDTVIGISSAGALRKDIDVPSISIPADYVNFWNIVTFYEQSIKHVNPNMSSSLRNKLIQGSQKIKDIKVRTEDVYVQTTGPRLETKAEVRILQPYGDVVGMTMAPEATLCREINVDYASLVTVDNHANGILEKPVRYDDIIENAGKSRGAVFNILENFLKNRR
ncbi:MAG: MTAP family purine nucleoside phosphorylase [Thermoplasmata archaeon]